MTELFEKAKVHLDRDEIDQAAICLTGHLNKEFTDPAALMMLGYCHVQKGNVGVAAALLQMAITLRPDFAEAWRNLGGAFKVAHKTEDAEKAWLVALKQETEPAERAKTLACLGTLYINEGNPAKALEYFGQAIAIEPKSPVILWNQSLALLEVGQWREGFRGYEHRFPTGMQRSRKYGDLKAWQGEPGKRVIVWGEQGIGDEILFASVLPDMIKNCSKVIFDCHPRLTKLFGRSFPGVEIHGTRKLMSSIPWYKPGMADAHISLSSLPVLYRQKDADFSGAPFLKADADEVAKLRGTPTRPRIGIAWAGGTHKTRTDLRSVPLEQWLPILKAIDADFYSLQYTPQAAKEVCELEEKHGIRVRHFPGWVECKDYDRTASFAASMDLIITCCTAMFHVGGGLGVPTWCLVPAKPAWRYGTEGERSPWYGSAKMIRQTGDNWAPTITRVAEELSAWKA